MSYPRELPILPRRLIAMEKKQLAIALCRVSSDEQLKNNSLNRQNAAVQKIAESYNLEIIKIWSGSVSSKRGKNTKRKDLTEMVEFCKANKRVKYLVVDEPDRFMRSIDEAFHFEVVFKELGVKLLYSDPELNSDSLYSKMQRFLKYFAAEGSNEERIKKSVEGGRKAIEEGRYPFQPPLGYKPGLTRGVADIDPIIGPLLRAQLIRIADGIVSPTIALIDFNQSLKLAGVKKASLKMDKWRAICLNPYYCGVVEMHKAIDASNPNGLHEKLITPEQHERIVNVFNNKPKNQAGPNSDGNPRYPFSNMVVHTDCPFTKSKYNTFVGVTIRNSHGKPYEKYRCRGCYMCISRDEMREKIGEIASTIELTEAGKKALDDALEEVFDLEAGDIEAEKVKLYSQRKNALKESDRLSDAYSFAPDGPMREQLLEKHKKAVGRVKYIDEELNKLSDIEITAIQQFAKFARDFVDDLVHKILELSPHDMKLCKQLLFPNGFFLSDDANVYTHRFSPIYRWPETKIDPLESKNSWMVRVKRL